MLTALDGKSFVGFHVVACIVEGFGIINHVGREVLGNAKSHSAEIAAVFATVPILVLIA